MTMSADSNIETWSYYTHVNVGPLSTTAFHAYSIFPKIHAIYSQTATLLFHSYDVTMLNSSHLGVSSSRERRKLW